MRGIEVKIIIILKIIKYQADFSAHVGVRSQDDPQSMVHG